jgi:transaldolase/glucose-6-phosphate isomerase
MTAPVTTRNPVAQLLDYGQSPWLDYIRRDLMTSGELQRLIEEDGLRGMTSNPAIFEKSIASSSDYADLLNDPQYASLAAKAIYEQIAFRDVKDAADIMRSVYGDTDGYDGYVSLEVAPTLAHDTQGTLEEARLLWHTVSRPNIMIKVPATTEGIPAIRQLISEGINVNVTLLFAQGAYEQVAEAYISGLEARAKAGEDVSGIASVASFFISRIDSKIDALLSERIKTPQDGEKSKLESLLGKVAIANARLTYQAYLRIFSGARWDALAAKGAQTQRLLWASTSTKNPAYRDVIYVEELIGRDTVNTMPPATFDAFRDHGQLRNAIIEDIDGAHATMKTLADVGISMDAITAQLLDEGVKLFDEAFTKLLLATNRS